MDRRLFLGGGASLAGLTAFFPDGSSAQTAPSAASATMMDKGMFKKALTGANRIAIIGARVAVQAGNFQTKSFGGSSWTAAYDVSGIGGADLTAVADGAIADFSSQLTGIGRTVIPREEIEAQKALKELDLQPQPIRRPWKYNNFSAQLDLMWGSDSSGRLWFYHLDNWSPFGALATKNWQKMNGLAVDLKAVILLPTYVYSFGGVVLTTGKQSTDGDYLVQEASVEAAAQMKLLDYPTNLWAFHGLIRIAGAFSDLKFKGDIPLALPGELKEIGNDGRNARFQFQADPARFRTLALTGASAANRFHTEVIRGFPAKA